MNTLTNYFVGNVVQCWGCAVFDKLFGIISIAAAQTYDIFVKICFIVFCVLFAFFVFNAVWQNLRPDSDNNDIALQKTMKPMLINSLVALALLGMGVSLPRFITTLTVEPAATIALMYTESMTHLSSDDIEARVKSPKSQQITTEGFYRVELRDKIILLMKATVSQLQSYMKLGVAVMSSAFEWKALLGVGAFLRHLLVLFIGMYLFYGFFKLFIQFCFYFADAILAITFFAFFFPISLLLMAFKGANPPKWIENLGQGIGPKQLKNLINAVITLVSVILTYTVIMAIIAKFFSAHGMSSAQLMHMITAGDIFEADLSQDNLATLTLGSCVVMLYVLTFIYDQIPQVTKMVLSAFNVQTNDDTSKGMAQDFKNLTGGALKKVTNLISGDKTGGNKTGGNATGGGKP